MIRPTRVLTLDPDRPDAAILDEAAAILRDGGLVAFPTETVYGLGADATNGLAVAKIFHAKGRPANNPLIVHAATIENAREAVDDWPEAAARLAQCFWPGPLTFVLPRSARIPDAVTAGHDTVGVRIPDNGIARALIGRSGCLVAAPSANRSTGVSPTRAGHVLEDLDGRVDLILDGGPAGVGIESTVLDLTADPPRLLRPGAITADQIGRVLGVEVVTPPRPAASSTPNLTSPGQLEVHYAPTTPVQLIVPEELRTTTFDGPVGLLVAGRTIPESRHKFERQIEWREPSHAARELYETLRSWDDGQLQLILVVLPEDDDAWRAVRDRLWRASRRWSREGL